jgi:hypothetical protein
VKRVVGMRGSRRGTEKSEGILGEACIWNEGF